MAKRKNSPAPAKAKFNLNFDYLLLALCLILSLGALYKEYYRLAPAPATKTDTSASVKKIIQPNAFFYTEVLLDRKKTYITFPYRFDANPLVMYLMVQTQAGYPSIERLVMHPTLYSLKWQAVTSADLTLFQRTQRYNSVASFLENPPDLKMVLIDPTVVSLTGHKFESAGQLSDNNSTLPDSVNYVLTTYKPVNLEKGWFAYENLLNTETAQENIHRELVWQLQVPAASEASPFYLGEVHVDFRQ